MEQCPFW